MWRAAALHARGYGVFSFFIVTENHRVVFLFSSGNMWWAEVSMRATYANEVQNVILNLAGNAKIAVPTENTYDTIPI